jgi:hypothetical protein
MTLSSRGAAALEKLSGAIPVGKNGDAEYLMT